MTLAIWNARSGYNFGTIQEKTIVNQALPIIYPNLFQDSSDVIFTVISGILPPGLRIQNDRIIGTPFEVPRLTEFKFVIRATYNNEISDRTFTMSVNGADEPTWNTAAGLLPVGPNQVFYILDNSYVDFQLSATDYDTAAGQELKYFIASDNGELPPGLILTDTGRIAGWVQPILALPADAGDGFYDTSAFDSVGLDFGNRPTNGYDSFVYDNIIFDYSTISLPPRKLNRNYEFVVTITDGDNIISRQFRVYVVGDDFFRADSVIVHAGTSAYMADVTYVRAPIWITPANLGIRRANNYQTFKLDTYEGILLGPIVYSLDERNPDNSLSTLPPGLQFDPSTAEIFGVIPYQPAITKNYQFTVTASRLSDRNESATSKRTFNVSILGEVESAMQWHTAEELGSIEANLISTFAVSAISTVPRAIVLYVKIDGELPPGLILNLDGSITGKVIQFGDNTADGLITFDQGDLLLDNGTTTFDREYMFTVKASDPTAYSAITRTFKLVVNTPNNKLYSNISVKPYLKPVQRELLKSFITNSDVFPISAIYRPSDSNFGLQTELKMLIYSGIETKTAAVVASAISSNHRKKRFKLGDIKTAKAVNRLTGEIVYEIIYIDCIDPLELGNKKLSTNLLTSPQSLPITVDQTNSYFNGPFDADVPFWQKPTPMSVTSDANIIFAGDPYSIFKKPASIALWRQVIKQLGDTERNYLPLWMRTVQTGSVNELGYVKAIPLCYCKPGMSTDILLNIKYNNFNFTQIDYEIDRYTIDSVTGEASDKYIVFKNDRTTII